MSFVKQVKVLELKLKEKETHAAELRRDLED
jgi:hypothetical protein